MPTPDPSAAEPRPALPPNRYGRTRKPVSRRVLIPLASTLAALGVAGALYATWATGRHAQGRVVSFQTSDSGVQITANIRRDPARDTECVLRARNHDGAEVGRRVLVIPSGGESRLTVSEFLSTRERPVTGEIRDCRSVG